MTLNIFQMVEIIFIKKIYENKNFINIKLL